MKTCLIRECHSFILRSAVYTELRVSRFRRRTSRFSVCLGSVSWLAEGKTRETGMKHAWCVSTCINRRPDVGSRWRLCSSRANYTTTLSAPTRRIYYYYAPRGLFRERLVFGYTMPLSISACIGLELELFPQGLQVFTSLRFTASLRQSSPESDHQHGKWYIVDRWIFR